MSTLRVDTAPTPTLPEGSRVVLSPGAELKALLWLAAPIAAVNCGNVLLGVVDSAVVGRLGEIEFGAVGLGDSVYFSVTIIGLGIMLGLDPLIAQAIGAGQPALARRQYWQGLYIAMLVGVPLTLATLGLTALLPVMGIAAETIPHTEAYIYTRLPSLIPFLMFIGSRSYLQAIENTRPMVYAVILANLINLPASWLLVFGDAGLERLGLPGLGIPALGTGGAGLASTISVLLQLAILAVVVGRVRVPSEGSLRRPDARMIKRALWLGLPIGLQLLAEVGVFGAVTVVMGNIGPSALAGHNAALKLASLAFMVPLGIGAAAAVRVGHAVGRQDVPATRRSGLVAIVFGAGVMLLSAAAFLLFPASLAAILSDKQSVISAAVPMILVAAVFQVSDGTQAVAFGALRGAGDTTFPMWANVAGHYALGLPLGLALTFGLGIGAAGLWWGLSAGLTAVAIALTIRFLGISTKPVARV